VKSLMKLFFDHKNTSLVSSVRFKLICFQWYLSAK